MEYIQEEVKEKQEKNGKSRAKCVNRNREFEREDPKIEGGLGRKF